MKMWFAMAAALLLAAPFCPGAEGARLEPTTGALFTAGQQSGWQAGLRLGRGRREFALEPDAADANGSVEDVLELNVEVLLFRAGLTPLPFLNLWAEAGTTRVELMTDDQGDTGLAWGGGATLRILDLPVETSPVIGQKKAFSLGVDVSYHARESNFDDRDFHWNDLRVYTRASYRHNRTGDARWFTYEPDGVAVHGGPVYVHSAGDYGETSIEERRDFGLRLQFDLLWASGWTAGLDGVFLGSDERAYSLRMMRNF
jgi:hypothetical protein